MCKIPSQSVRIARKAMQRLCPPQENYGREVDSGEWSDSSHSESEEKRARGSCKKIARMIEVDAEELELAMYVADCREYDMWAQSKRR